MSRDIKRQIIKERAGTNRIGGEFGPWAHYQRGVYGDSYESVRRSGMHDIRPRHSFAAMNQRAVVPAAKPAPISLRIAARNAIASFMAKITRKPARREATA